ncbi:unnamed protein product, partial [Gulo gulo]
NVDITREGPQGSPAEGHQSHQCRSQSPCKEEALRGQMVSTTPELATVCPVCTICSCVLSTVKDVATGLPFRNEVWVHSLPHQCRCSGEWFSC